MPNLNHQLQPESPAPQKVSESWLNDSLSVNLDEVVIEELDVAFVEREPVQNENGSTSYRLRPRIAHITAYVPMDVFNKMMDSYQRFTTEEDNALRIQWMAQQVLNVWKLSEPDMTLDRLMAGLDFKKINALFARFFASQLPQNDSKA